MYELVLVDNDSYVRHVILLGTHGSTVLLASVNSTDRTLASRIADFFGSVTELR